MTLSKLCLNEKKKREKEEKEKRKKNIRNISKIHGTEKGLHQKIIFNYVLDESNASSLIITFLPQHTRTFLRYYFCNNNQRCSHVPKLP